MFPAKESRGLAWACTFFCLLAQFQSILASHSNTKSALVPSLTEGRSQIATRVKRSDPTTENSTQTALPSCSTQSGSGVDRDLALYYILGFCNDTNGMVFGGSSSESYDMGDGMGLNITSTVNAQCLGNNTLTQQDCTTAFKTILDGCNTDSYQNKHGGTLISNCGNWSLAVTSHEGELDCATFIAGSPGVDRSQAINNIQDFCSKNANLSVSPDLGATIPYLQPSRNITATISVEYSSQCSQENPAPYNLTETTCNWFFGRVIDGCNTNTTASKYGGNVTDGCGVFSFEL